MLPEQVSRLRKEVDLVVLLSHLGLATDRRLAEEIPEIDIILGGHTHHLLEEPERVGQTWLAAAGKFGEHVGHVTITFDPAGQKIIQVKGRFIPVSAVDPDPKMVKTDRGSPK